MEQGALGQRLTEEGLGEVVSDTAVQIGERRVRCLLVRTHVIRAGEDIPALMKRYLEPLMRPGDVVFIGQKAASAAQGRAYPVDEIRPRWLARFLCRFVRKVGYGIGLGIPETMEMAIREVGVLRILVAAVVGAIGRLFGRRGDFYRVAGRRVAAIDGPTPYTLPPYNRYVVLAPRDPDGLCQEIVRAISPRRVAGAAIVDVNDIGANVLGASPGVDRRMVALALRGNPMGQGAQRTPIGIIRPL
ncbi:MAG TPA: F420-0--gamma-glutamyl ligase [Firmicutes bacterium]|nr:F420-0--gamma-glutamyl ligase [Bacillota bacterium]